MILITGGTGFVGNRLTQQLVSLGYPLRILIRPNKVSPNLPRSTSVDVVVCGLNDERGLKAAMKGVNMVYHLAGSERMGSQANLEEVEVEGTRMIANAAQQAGVERLVYLSHLGVDRASAYPVMKAKALAEGFIQQSGVPFTVIRSAVIFGEGDHFTNSLVEILRVSPGIFLIPGDGENLLQPLWIDDAVMCLSLSIENPELIGKTISIGGPEYFSFRQVLNILSDRVGIRRRYINVNPAILRPISLYFEQSKRPLLPLAFHWLDYLATDRTCPVESIPRQFGLLPSRFTQHLEYLHPIEKKRKH